MKRKLVIFDEGPADAFLTMLTIIAFVIVAYMLILKLTGHSPSLEDLTIGMLIAMFANMMRIEGKLGEFREFKHNTAFALRKIENSSNNVAIALPGIRRDLRGLYSRLSAIEQKI